MKRPLRQRRLPFQRSQSSQSSNTAAKKQGQAGDAKQWVSTFNQRAQATASLAAYRPSSGGSTRMRQTRLRRTNNNNNNNNNAAASAKEEDDEDEQVGAAVRRKRAHGATIVSSSSSSAEEEQPDAVEVAVLARDTDDDEEETVALPRHRRNVLVVGEDLEPDRTPLRRHPQANRMGDTEPPPPPPSRPAKRASLKRQADWNEELESARKLQQKQKNRQALELLRKNKKRGKSTRARTNQADASLESTSPEEDSYADGSEEDDFIVGSDEEVEESGDDTELPSPFLPIDKASPVRRGKAAKAAPRLRARVVDDASSEGNVEDEDEEEEEMEEEDERRRQSPRRNTKRRQEHDWAAQMPMEFTAMSKQPLSHSFDILMQALASEVMDPGFIEEVYQDRDEYFLTAIHKLDTLVFSKKTSVVQSSIWSADFKNDLETYPDCDIRSVSTYEQDLCRACNRSGRVATFELRLHGQPYHPTYLQPTQDSPSENSYKVGRFCKVRSTNYHKMHHYKLHLLEDVRAQIEALQNKGLFGDREDATEVVEHVLNDRTYMNSVFHTFKSMLELGESYAIGEEG